MSEEKKLNCFHCGDPGHKKKDCTVKKPLSKPVPPPAVTALTQESDRACLICDSKGHEAVDCKTPSRLKDEFSKFVESSSDASLDLGALTKILSTCVRCLDFRGAVFLYDRLVETGNTPSSEIIALLRKLNDIGGKDMSKVAIEKMTPRLANSRITLKSIVKQFRVEANITQISSQHKIVESFILAHLPEAEACSNRFALAAFFGKACKLSNKQARDMTKYLSDNGFISQQKKGFVFNFGGEKASSVLGSSAAAGGSQKPKQPKVTRKIAPKRKQEGDAESKKSKKSKV